MPCHGSNAALASAADGVFLRVTAVAVGDAKLRFDLVSHFNEGCSNESRNFFWDSMGSQGDLHWGWDHAVEAGSGVVLHHGKGNERATGCDAGQLLLQDCVVC